MPMDRSCVDDFLPDPGGGRPDGDGTDAGDAALVRSIGVGVSILVVLVVVMVLLTDGENTPRALSTTGFDATFVALESDDEDDDTEEEGVVG